jgi:hypothetical protein
MKSGLINTYQTSLIFLFFALYCGLCAQTEGPKPPKIKDYKSDSSYLNYNHLRVKVAKAQINLLKTNGALLVRLKTNANTIAQLKAAGNIDLATQLERETILKNKTIIASYQTEFKFCPVYFFYSNVSDSVKHRKLDGIFVDSNLTVNSAILCNATFFLIAEEDKVYNSSLGMVPESDAGKAMEKGTPIRDAAIVIKNRYFIQLHKPFPFFVVRASSPAPLIVNPGNVYFDLNALHDQAKRQMTPKEAKQLIRLQHCVKSLNNDFQNFYAKNKDYVITPDLIQYVY